MLCSNGFHKFHYGPKDHHTRHGSAGCPPLEGLFSVYRQVDAAEMFKKGYMGPFGPTNHKYPFLPKDKWQRNSGNGGNRWHHGPNNNNEMGGIWGAACGDDQVSGRSQDKRVIMNSDARIYNAYCAEEREDKPVNKTATKVRQ